MRKYSVVPFKTLDELVHFNARCFQLHLEFTKRRAVMKAIHKFDDGYPGEFDQYQTVLFLDEAAMSVLKAAGVSPHVLKVIKEDDLPRSTGRDLGPRSAA